MRKLIAGTVHNKVPADLAAALAADKSALLAWQSLTPLARNEWICWVISVKKQATRDKHVARTVN